MPLFGTPKWPVVDPNPDLSKAAVNVNAGDVGYIVGLPTLGAVGGYLSGKL